MGYGQLPPLLPSSPCSAFYPEADILYWKASFRLTFMHPSRQQVESTCGYRFIYSPIGVPPPPSLPPLTLLSSNGRWTSLQVGSSPAVGVWFLLGGKYPIREVEDWISEDGKPGWKMNGCRNYGNSGQVKGLAMIPGRFGLTCTWIRVTR